MQCFASTSSSSHFTFHQGSLRSQLVSVIAATQTVAMTPRPASCFWLSTVRTWTNCTSRVPCRVSCKQTFHWRLVKDETPSLRRDAWWAYTADGLMWWWWAVSCDEHSLSLVCLSSASGAGSLSAASAEQQHYKITLNYSKYTQWSLQNIK